MLILNDQNDVRTRFFNTPRLPNYEVIKTGVNISSMITKSFIYRGIIINNGIKDYVNNAKYLYNTSFSINDVDYGIEPIRVFITGNGDVYLGKVENDIELIKSILLYVAFYMQSLVSTINTCITSELSSINRTNISNSFMLHDIKIDLVAKTSSISYSVKMKASRRYPGTNSSFITMIPGQSKAKMEIYQLSKAIYSAAKRSLTEYNEYISKHL